MNTVSIPERWRKFEVPGRIALETGNGGLPKIAVTTAWSTAEIYLHGAQVTGFKKDGEAPLLFLSARSWFAPGKSIRGGVPICYPWFGPRAGETAHGLVRFLAWELAATAAAEDSAVTIRLRLPETSMKPEWSALQTEFVVTVADRLTMELLATHEGAGAPLAVENCLHTYFQVGDIGAVSLAGLQGAPFDDFAAGANGARKSEAEPVLRITRETNRVYPNHPVRWKSATNSSNGLFAWRNSTRGPRWCGIRGRRRSCRTILIRRNTGAWSAWNPAM